MDGLMLVLAAVIVSTPRKMKCAFFSYHVHEGETVRNRKRLRAEGRTCLLRRKHTITNFAMKTKQSFAEPGSVAKLMQTSVSVAVLTSLL
jgi:hypothetical protein